MDVAELYLSLTRPSAIPVVGECVADGFVGQVQIERWSWNLMNDDEIKRAEKDERDYDAHREFLSKLGDPRDIGRQADRLALAQIKLDEARKARQKIDEEVDDGSAAAQESANFVKSFKGDKGANGEKLAAALSENMARFARQQAIERNNRLREASKGIARASMEIKGLTKDLSREQRDYLEALDKQVGEAATKQEELERRIKASDEDYAKRNKSYEFNFSKRVDFATTQMLNSMKAGDVFPLALLTINQRSSNAGMVLIFTVTELRLLDYSLRAEVSETMTDMKEQWKAEFRSLAYVYKNRRAIESSDDAAEAATKMATQGTVRTFAMKKDLGI